MAIRDFLVGIGMVFVIEGLLFAAFPGMMRNAMKNVLESPETLLRGLGLAMAVLGVVLVGAIRYGS
ncbi:MAG: DUF2065 domain-containing protein [Afipia sp.]|nr:DUF2065 domain-containing protein [Afipia sp.]OJW64496.1 MAG: hypothetical protein BGO65_16335 [Afipia sp. 64-13]